LLLVVEMDIIRSFLLYLTGLASSHSATNESTHLIQDSGSFVQLTLIDRIVKTSPLSILLLILLQFFLLLFKLS
jgi:hypothetical protein